MKKILVYLLLLLAGVGIGYFLNFDFKNEDIAQEDTEEIYVEKVKKKVIKSKSEVEKTVETPVQDDSQLASDNDFIVDTLSTEEDYIEPSQNTESEEVIIMEELVAQRTITLGPSPNDTTDVSEMLNLKSKSFSKDIVVEFWQSPLNITGYELTRNRLKLFGFNPNESISLQLDKNEEQILLNTESMSIVLQKSKQFKTLKLR
jgi:hypothetical protein